MLTCAECLEPIGETTKNQRDRSRAGKPVYCAKTCSDRAQARQSSERMAATNRKHASKRMRERNPMQRPESRAKMRETLRGRAPTRRGGNGTGLSAAETLLSNALGWEPHVVPTGKPRRPGWPTHFKLDLANPDLMIAVEIDGRSHGAIERQEQDERKAEFLASLGWTVLRFSNEEATAHTADCCREVWSTISKSQGRRRTP
jgi:hypothetical protein